MKIRIIAKNGSHELDHENVQCTKLNIMSLYHDDNIDVYADGINVFPLHKQNIDNIEILSQEDI